MYRVQPASVANIFVRSPSLVQSLPRVWYNIFIWSWYFCTVDNALHRDFVRCVSPCQENKVYTTCDLRCSVILELLCISVQRPVTENTFAFQSICLLLMYSSKQYGNCCESSNKFLTEKNWHEQQHIRNTTKIANKCRPKMLAQKTVMST